jgi:pyruvate,water dikinase
MRRCAAACGEGSGGADGIPVTAEDVLRGSPCSPGRVVAPAIRVLRPEPGLNARGKVIVARSTDPGWAFLLVDAAGLVVERGNLLSHVAIICRELGVPTVIGVPSATRLIDDGALVELDGAAGTVRVADKDRTATDVAVVARQGS